MSLALSGQDTIQLDERILNDLADGDAVALTYPTDIATVKVGKNGNALFGLNEAGKQADMVLRVVRGSADDKYLNSRMAAQDNNFAGFVLLAGEFIKRIGDGAGNIAGDTIIASSGVFNKHVEVKSNVEGDTGQAVSEYHIKFAKAVRVIT